jgi:hypothetical protein
VGWHVPADQRQRMGRVRRCLAGAYEKAAAGLRSATLLRRLATVRPGHWLGRPAQRSGCVALTS